MNTEIAKQEITNIITEQQKRQPSRKQYPVTKTQLRELEALRLISLMPSGFRYTDAELVIKAAKDNGKDVGGFTNSGDGDVVRTHASALYVALNN